MKNREQPKHDGILRREFTFELKADTLNEQDRSVKMIASTNAVDSYGDIVEQYWDMERYDANPVVLYNHNRKVGGGWFDDSSVSQLESLPVGFSLDHGVTGGRLEFHPKFVDEHATPLAENVWQSVRQRSLRTASVGFRPGAIERLMDQDGKPTGGYRLGSPTNPNKLVEISIVPLPANHEAVALAMGADHEFLERELHQRAARAADRSHPMPEKEEPGANPEPKSAPDASADKQRELEQENERLRADKAKQDDELARLRSEKQQRDAEASEAKLKGYAGTKFPPVALDSARALRNSAPDKFDAFMSVLPDMLSGLKADVTGGQPPEERSTSTAEDRITAAARGESK